MTATDKDFMTKIGLLYQVFAPCNTTLEIMVYVVGQRWRIDECFKLVSISVGLRWLRSPFLVGIASSYDPCSGCPSIFGSSSISGRANGGNTIPPFDFHPPWQSGCVQSGKRVVVKLSVAQMRRWLCRLLFPVAWSGDLNICCTGLVGAELQNATARYYHYSIAHEAFWRTSKASSLRLLSCENSIVC